MYVQREESVHICFVQDKETNGKRHISGRPAQGEKLLGDPAAVQSLAAMVQATALGYRQPSTEKNNQQRENSEKSEVTYQFSLCRNLGSKLCLSLKPTVLCIQFHHA